MGTLQKQETPGKRRAAISVIGGQGKNFDTMTTISKGRKSTKSAIRAKSPRIQEDEAINMT